MKAPGSTGQRWSVLGLGNRVWIGCASLCLSGLLILGSLRKHPQLLSTSQVSESYLVFSLAVWMGAGRLKTITGWLLLVWDPCAEAAWWGVCPMPGHRELCRRSGGVRGCRGMKPCGMEGPEPWMFVPCMVLSAGASTWGGGSGGCQPCQWVTSGLWGQLGIATD